jgi:hypothetical protein
MRKTDLSNEDICAGVSEMITGLINAELGGGVVKKRIALPGRGKSGGARLLVATNKCSRWFFIFGFEKNERANIDRKELEALQEIATNLLGLDSKQLDAHVSNGSLQEICHDYQNQGN